MSKKSENVFNGDPEGFLRYPEGTIFGRKGYKFYIKPANSEWRLLNLYSEKSPELTNDVNGKVWYKTTEDRFSTGWIYLSTFSNVPISISPTEESGDYLIVDDSLDSVFLYLDSTEELLIIS